MRFSIINGWPQGGHGGGFSLQKKVIMSDEIAIRNLCHYRTMMGGGVGGHRGSCRQTIGGSGSTGA